MLCPRCGQEAEGMARACSSCGYILPFSMRKRHTASPTSPHFAAATPPAEVPPSASGAHTRADQPTESLPTDPPAPQTPDDWLFPEEPPQRAPATRPLPPTLRPTAGAERESTLLLPALSTDHIDPLSSGQWSPMLGQPDSGTTGSMALSAISGSMPMSAITGAHRVMSDTTGSMAALSAGTLLKGGRYRLLHRFVARNATMQREDPEPPLFFGSDAERPSSRVLMQELPLADLGPDQAERLLQRVARRYDQSETSAMLPALLDSFTERRRHFLVFQLPDGDVLAERLRRHGPMPEPDVIRLGLQVLDVLALLEQATPAITHGNLSADHIIMRRDGNVQLVGLSSTLLAQFGTQQSHRPSGGMYGYAAPEQQRGQADARTDMFALAGVLLFALTGKDPSLGSGPLKEPGRAGQAPVSPALGAVVSRALRPAPAQRYQTLAEMRSALAALANAPAASDMPAFRALPGRSSITSSGLTRRLPGAAGALRAALIERPSMVSRGPARLRVAVAVLLLLSMVGVSFLYAAHSRQRVVAPIPAASEDRGAAALFLQKNIGVSAGELVFDRQRADGALKAQGARALAAHDLPAALAAFKQAMAADRTDAEAAIYAENVGVALGHDPVATIVVGVAFGSDGPASESALQGVYLAQVQANALDLLPGTTRLRVLIANAGAVPADAATVGGLVARALASGNPLRIVGVVGWPSGPQTLAAAPTLAASGIPVIAPAAALPDLHSTSYFALAPSDVEQGRALADAAATVLSSHRVFVLADPTASQSLTLADAFTTQTTQAYAGKMTITHRETFALGHTDDFSQPVRDALSTGSDTILITGSDADVVYLAQAVAQLAPSYGASPRILASTLANTPKLLGEGSDNAAQLVRSQPSMMSAVNVASLAATGEWSAIGVPQGLQPSLASDYETQFGHTTASGGLALPDATAILAYDGVELLCRAVTHASHAESLPAFSAVTAALGDSQGDVPFQGVGGAIVHKGPGAPISKALALESLRAIDNPPPNGPTLTADVTAVVGGRATFCGAGSCVAP